MANNRNHYSQNTRILMNVLATVLILAILLGCVIGGLQIWGTGNAKPSNWGKGETAIVQPDDTGKEDPSKEEPGKDDPSKEEPGKDDQDQHVDASESHGIRLMAASIPIEMYEQYGISPASVESAYTITAKIEPKNATNKEVDWTVYFQNDSSEWATGKTVTDYVSIKPGEEASCVVTCAQAFGEPIMVKVASHEDSSIFATKQFDYVERLRDRIDSASEIFGSFILYFGSSSYKFNLNFPSSYLSGVGTRTGFLTVTSVKYVFKGSDLLDKLKATDVVSKVNELLGAGSVDYNEDDYVFSNLTYTTDVAIPWHAFFKCNKVSDPNQLGAKAINMLKSALLEVLKSYKAPMNTFSVGHYEYTVTNSIADTSGGHVIETKTGTLGFANVNISSLTVGITDLKFEDSGNLYF